MLLVTDLHGGNILAAQRAPWLVVDPKPYIGDPTYDPMQHMTNCADRLATDPIGLCNRMATLTGVDAGRLRLWIFARLVVDSGWPFGTDGNPTNYELARRIAP
ncbi:MAG: aminoglycoside phosphotransferase family protein [Actinomycetota bacterium]